MQWVGFVHKYLLTWFSSAAHYQHWLFFSLMLMSTNDQLSAKFITLYNEKCIEFVSFAVNQTFVDTDSISKLMGALVIYTDGTKYADDTLI